MDCWTDSRAQSFITITVHFINNEWEMTNFISDTAPFNESHTANNLLHNLKKQADIWKIEEKIQLVFSDNAANNLAALWLSDWQNMGCIAHKLNLVVQDATYLDPRF